MRTRAALIDLGGTLVDFFGNGNAEMMVPCCLRRATAELSSRGLPVPSAQEQERRWSAQKRPPSDLMVHPLEDRLCHVYGIDPADRGAVDAACRAFTRPLFRGARLFEDALPFLEALKERGVRTVLVSNTTWGTPAVLFREEVARHGLDRLLDGTVFCRDVGWRKPDGRIFAHALAKAGAAPSECLFIGDDPVWDVEGPGTAGIPAVLLDRRMAWAGQDYDRVCCLGEVIGRLR